MNCVVFCIKLVVGFEPLGKGIYLSFHNGCRWRRSVVAFLALDLFLFHLQITCVYNIITSPVTRKLTDLALEKLSVNPFSK